MNQAQSEETLESSLKSRELTRRWDLSKQRCLAELVSLPIERRLSIRPIEGDRPSRDEPLLAK